MKTENEKLRVILYPRVSSPKQLKEGDSINAQIERLEFFCKEKGYDIVDTYTDGGKSASISDDKFNINIKNGKFVIGINLSTRPAFKKLLEEAKEKKFEAIVFFKWDRFSRNMIFSKIAQIYFKRHNISLIPSDDVTDPLMIEIKGILGQEEIRKNKERVQSTRNYRFNQGIMVGRSPFGYKYNRRKKMMVIDEKEAQIVREIFDLKISGMMDSQIAKKIGKGPQSVTNIRKNKVYIGIVQFEGKEIKGKHESIITEEIFKKVNPFE